jgi:hypothetical protein
MSSPTKTPTSSVPPLFGGAQAQAGMALVGHVRTALAEAGLPRNSQLSGGALAGLIEPNQFGSTGFSVKIVGAERLEFNVVVSGKPHLRYIRQGGEGGSEPHEPERLAPRVKQVFESLGFTVQSVHVGGWQTTWDDDVDYVVVTDYPAVLGRDEQVIRRYLAFRLDAVRHDRAAMVKESAAIARRISETDAELLELDRAMALSMAASYPAQERGR